jgi:tRNA (guanine37-N1)-methyltransferase
MGGIKSFLGLIEMLGLGAVSMRSGVRSFDVIGDIAVLRVPEELLDKAEEMAEAVMETNRHVKTVLRETGHVDGIYRTRMLEWLKGEMKTETTHREYGCIFKVDLAKVYFSPRLAYERRRLTGLVELGEVVLNMFAGVGSFSIMIARCSQASRVYSVDLNPDAARYMALNVWLNRVSSRVVVIFGEAESVVKRIFTGRVDRVLMPLPMKAYGCLEVAVKALKTGGGHIHYYDFAYAGKGDDPVSGVVRKVSEKLVGMGVDFNVDLCRVIRTVGSNWYQLVVDLSVKGAKKS